MVCFSLRVGSFSWGDVGGMKISEVMREFRDGREEFRVLYTSIVL